MTINDFWIGYFAGTGLMLFHQIVWSCWLTWKHRNDCGECKKAKCPFHSARLYEMDKS